MDVAALVLAAVAVLLFVFRPVLTNVALAVTVVALACQFVHLTGHLVTVN